MGNFAVDVVERAPADRLAIVELARDGARREWSFGAVAQAARTLAAHLHEHGVRRGDTVLTLVGNQPEWVAAMVACFRQGYVVLPCNEQLRAKDLRAAARRLPAGAVVCDGATRRCCAAPAGRADDLGAGPARAGRARRRRRRRPTSRRSIPA